MSEVDGENGLEEGQVLLRWEVMKAWARAVVLVSKEEKMAVKTVIAKIGVTVMGYVDFYIGHTSDILSSN